MASFPANLTLGLLLVASSTIGGRADEAGVEMVIAQKNLALLSLSRDERLTRSIDTILLGNLELPTGRVVATDPVTSPDRAPFERTVPAGDYPVTLYLHHMVVALAAVRLGDGEVERWELATTEGQSLDDLGPDEMFGYGVDTGLGSFMDASVARYMEQREDAEIEQARGTSDVYADYFSNVLMDELSDDAPYLMHRPTSNGPNVAVFRSGWGDGYYASYWGFGENGEAIILATDFRVFEDVDHYGFDAVANLTPEQRDANIRAYQALLEDDIEALRELLRTGLVHAESWVVEAGGTFTFEAIRLDKPSTLELLIRHGAPIQTATPLLDRTYPDLARSYSEEGGPLQLVPRSDELMSVIRRWEDGLIATN